MWRSSSSSSRLSHFLYRSAFSPSFAHLPLLTSLAQHNNDNAMQSRSIVHQLFFAWRRTQSYIKEQTERIAANIAATEQMRQQLSKDTSSLQEHTKVRARYRDILISC